MIITKKLAINRMAALCSRKEYCCSQIAEKLRKLCREERCGCGESEVAARNADRYGEEGAVGDVSGVLEERDIEDIVGVLKKEGYINDERFASAYVNDKLQFGGWGKNKIVYGLRGLGISSDIIERAVSERYDDKSRNVVERLVEAKFKIVGGKADARNRVIRYMLGKGFGYDEIIKVINKRREN